MPESPSRHGLFGPLVLVLTGILLLLGRLGIIALDWPSIWRFWPVLVIFYGLDMLFGRATWRGLFGLVLLGAIAWVGFGYVGVTGADSKNVVTDRYEYVANGIESAQVRIKVGAGVLDIQPLVDSPNLVEATVSYDPRRVRADFQVSDLDRIADITLVSQGDSSGMALLGGVLQSDWRVSLATGVPLAIMVDAGVCHAHLDLSRLDLASLRLNAGVGDMEISLPEHGTYQVQVDGGVGRLIIRMPGQMKARVRVDGGLGTVEISERFERDGRYYLTDGFEGASEWADIDVDGGLGAIVVE